MREPQRPGTSWPSSAMKHMLRSVRTPNLLPACAQPRMAGGMACSSLSSTHNRRLSRRNRNKMAHLQSQPLERDNPRPPPGVTWLGRRSCTGSNTAHCAAWTSPMSSPSSSTSATTTRTTLPSVSPSSFLSMHSNPLLLNRLCTLQGAPCFVLAVQVMGGSSYTIWCAQRRPPCRSGSTPTIRLPSFCCPFSQMGPHAPLQNT